MAKQKRVIRTAANYLDVIGDSRYEEMDSKSMTKPNEALTMKQIMDRATGNIPPAYRDAPYLDVENLDK